jgi:hypothetical protein
MIYRRPGLNAASPTYSPQLPSTSCLSFSVLLFVAGRGWPKSYDGEKALSSINHSILSGYQSGPGRKCATAICSKHKQRSLSHLPSSGCCSCYSNIYVIFRQDPDVGKIMNDMQLHHFICMSTLATLFRLQGWQG